MTHGVRVLAKKTLGVILQAADAAAGRLLPLHPTLAAMEARPFELHLELTNLCNANCVFCPYQFQQRTVQRMPDEVFAKAVGDFVACGGGSIGLTPIVGEPLLDRDFVSRVRQLRKFPEVDRIWVATNAILLDRHGAHEVLSSGLTSITVSTSGFDEKSYRRIFRTNSYQRFRANVLNLLAANRDLGNPVVVTIALRKDRPLGEVMQDVDFQEVLAFKPAVDFTWSFTSANGRITRELLPVGMRLRRVGVKREPCVQLYNGPIVLADGTVLACSCVAAMDAIKDLGIGNVLGTSLLGIWKGPKLRDIRRSFGTGQLNLTCHGCNMYRDLSLYRSREGRRRAALNNARRQGEAIRRPDRPSGAFSGG